MALVVMMDQPWIAGGLAIFGVALITPSKGFQIDQAQKKYRIYDSIFTMKYGQWREYNDLSKLFVNSFNTSQTTYSQSNRSVTAKKKKFAAFLKFDDGHTVRLYEDPDRKRLFAKLRQIAGDLDLKISDSTDG
ncbi:MAG: hypothetical protein RJQ09_15635 [Cyclobacteriaceae bacterium]